MCDHLPHFHSCLGAHLLAGSSIRGFCCCSCIPRLLLGAFVPCGYCDEYEATTCAFARKCYRVCDGLWRYRRSSVPFYRWGNCAGKGCAVLQPIIVALLVILFLLWLSL